MNRIWTMRIAQTVSWTVIRITETWSWTIEIGEGIEHSNSSQYNPLPMEKLKKSRYIIAICFSRALYILISTQIHFDTSDPKVKKTSWEEGGKIVPFGQFLCSMNVFNLMFILRNDIWSQNTPSERWRPWITNFSKMWHYITSVT